MSSQAEVASSCASCLRERCSMTSSGTLRWMSSVGSFFFSSRRRHTRSESTRLNSSHDQISYAVFCLKTKKHTSELQSRSDLVCRLLLENNKARLTTLTTIRPPQHRSALSRHGRYRQSSRFT